MWHDRRVSSDPLRRRLRRLSPAERREEALAFLQLYFREAPPAGVALAARQREVLRDLARHGYYEHTPEELAFGARIAWRNHANCIGRLHWKSLEVFDCRAITGPDMIAARLVEHLGQAQNGGRIRTIISIFAPVQGDKLPPWIESPQLVCYAGYSDDAAGVRGDPQNAELTRIVTQLGWQPPSRRTRFDILPMLLRDQSGRRQIYDLPAGSVQEVPITHPTIAAIGELGLKWYAVPVVSDTILTIGGIDYPCAPFNGFYMGTEIASRNFLDVPRYDLLEPLARAIGIDAQDPLYRDRVALEINRAVLTSFREAGVAIVDHHEASEQFIAFAHREDAAGRFTSANWAWIVPPQSSAVCPVFHLPMRDYADVPNYYRSRATDGERLRINREGEQRSRHWRRFDRERQRVRNWLRRHG